MHGYGGRVNWWGLLFIIGGAWWLLGELNYVPFEWRYLAPIAIILIGLSALIRPRWRHWGGHPGGACSCACSSCEPSATPRAKP